MRLSQENENRQGSPNRQPPPPPGTQKAVGLRSKFSRPSRVRKKEDFKRLRKAGRRMVGKWVFFDVLSENFPYPRLGITVSKKFGPAHQRNLFKRRVREAFRLSHLPPGMTLHVTPQQNEAVPSLAELLEEFSNVK